MVVGLRRLLLPQLQAQSPGCWAWLQFPLSGSQQEGGQGGGEERRERGGCVLGRLTWTAPWFVQEPCLGNKDHPGD